MVYTSQDSSVSEYSTNDSTTWKQDFCPQSSYKRRNSESCDQDDFEDISNKRECVTTKNLIACPLAEFGCISELSCDDLLKHYTTTIHQQALMKAVEIYVRVLHSKSINGHTQLNKAQSDHSEMLDTINILAEGVSCLHDDNVQIHTKFVQLHSAIIEQAKQIVQLQQSIAGTSQILNSTQMNNTILQTEIETMKQTLADSSSLSSNDGSYIWKITNFTEILANAIAERQTSIYSPAFYSSPTGYKMCMRLYPNGDGNARRTHLSLFFVIMRGDYDAILLWPFQYKISFCLFDQTGGQRHILDSFRPDIKSNSFHRPTSNMNIASGIPKFLPSSILQQENNPYLRDDCMFIRCMVDFDSLPKKCLPYTVNLNPGLPTMVQHNMIQDEVQKQRTTAAPEVSVMESSAATNDSKVNKSE